MSCKTSIDIVISLIFKDHTNKHGMFYNWKCLSVTSITGVYYLLGIFLLIFRAYK